MERESVLHQFGVERRLRTINLPSSPYRYYISGLLALSIAEKSREKIAQ